MTEPTTAERAAQTAELVQAALAWAETDAAYWAARTAHQDAAAEQYQRYRRIAGVFLRGAAAPFLDDG